MSLYFRLSFRKTLRSGEFWKHGPKRLSEVACQAGPGLQE